MILPGVICLSRVGLPGERRLPRQFGDRAGHAGDDARQDHQAHAVAQPVFIDLLAQPHQEDAPRRQRQQAHQPEDLEVIGR